MNNFITLTKAFFLSGFNVNKRKGNQRSAFSSLIIFGLLFFGFSLFYSSSLMISVTDPEAGLMMSHEDVLMLFIGLGALFVLMISIQQMQNVIFKTKDYEFLESLPVKKTTIVSAKIFAIYLIGLFEDIIIILPSILCYLFFSTNVNKLYIGGISFIFMFFASVGPLLIGSILACLTSLITAKMKHQNVVSIILTLVYLVAILSFSFTMSSGYSGLNTQTVFTILPYLKVFQQSFDITKFYLFIFVILGHIVSAILVVLFISAIYRPMNTYLENIKIHSEYVKTGSISKTSVKKVLLKKEFKMLFGTSQYAVNSLLGPVMFLIMGVFMAVMGTNISADTEMTLEDLEVLNIVMPSIILGFGIMMNMMASSTSASISLEAKNFENLLVLPVSPKEIIKAKVNVSLITLSVLNIVPCTVLSVICSIKYGFNIWLIIECFLFSYLGFIYTTLIGMVCGLRWPKLDFQNITQVLKQSSAVGLQMLFTALPSMFIMGIMILFNILGAIFSPVFNVLGLIIPLIILSVLTLISYLILHKNGEKLFNKVLLR